MSSLTFQINSDSFHNWAICCLAWGSIGVYLVMRRLVLAVNHTMFPLLYRYRHHKLQLVVIMVKMCNLWFPYSCHLYMAVLPPLWFDNHFLNCFLLVTWCPAGLPISKCSQVRTSTSRRIIIVVVSWLIVWLVTNSLLKLITTCSCKC